MANNEYLSKEQRQTVDQFLATHQLAQLRRVRDDSCCYRTVFVDWCHSTAEFNIFYCTELELTPAGKVRREQTQQLAVVRSVCVGQKALPLAQELVLPAPPPTKINHSLYSTKSKVRQPKAAKPQQLSLPLAGTTAKLQDIALAKGYPVQSEQELLSGKVQHYSLEQGKVFDLPEAIVELLKAANASFDEWECAIQLLGVSGAAGVLHYVSGLEVFRQRNGQQQTVSVAVPLKQTQAQTQGVANDRHNY